MKDDDLPAGDPAARSASRHFRLAMTMPWLAACVLLGCEFDRCGEDYRRVGDRCILQLDGGELPDGSVGDDKTDAQAESDASQRDGGAGDVDAAPTDAGDADAGEPDDMDASVPDAGPPDAGPPDAGPPCGGACAEPTPVCDPARARCVECIAATDCAGDRPVCDSDGTCVECLGHDDCGSDRPVCDSDGTCVECLAHDDCADPNRARCDTATNTCTGCMSNAVCSRFDDRPQCELGSQTCVACTPATEASHCGSHSCHPGTFECTSTVRGSRGFCEECVSDSDCESNHLCIALAPYGSLDGSYCMPLAAGGACSAPSPHRDTRTSALGTSGDVCVINEARVACPGVLRHGVRCSSGCASHAGSFCACSTAGCSSSPSAVCTYECRADDECPAGQECISDPSLGGYVCTW